MMTKFILAVLFVCLYVHSVVPHGAARGLIPRRRAFRPVVLPLQPQRRPHFPLPPFPGVPHQLILHKKYKSMLRMRASKMAHMLKKKRQFTKKQRIVIKGPRFPTARPLGPRPINIAMAGVQGLGRRPLPLMPSQINIPRTVPFSPILSNRRQMPRFVNRRTSPVRLPRLRDDFFDDGDFNDRRDDFNRFEDFDDIYDSFDSRFTNEFGSAGRIPIQARPSGNFGRPSVPVLPSPGVNPIPFPDTIRGPFPAQRFPDLGDLDDRSFNRISDFDDDSLKPRVPEFVENVLDNQKDFTENIRDEFKPDDSFPMIGGSTHRQFTPALHDKRDDGVPDLLDRDSKQSPDVINGFEMLGSRQRDRDSDIRNILKDNPFEQLGDPVLLDQFGDHSDKNNDDSPAGTFALLGIDPGTVQPFKNEDKAIRMAPTGQGIARPGSTQGFPGDWAMDFGLSVDQKVKKEAIDKDIPPPSTV